MTTEVRVSAICPAPRTPPPPKIWDKPKCLKELYHSPVPQETIQRSISSSTPTSNGYWKKPNSVFFLSSYETINGTAMSGSDYEAKKEVLVFKPGETLKHIDITIIDDNEWEENEVFFLKLCRFDYKDDTVEIGEQSITEVTIINDDGKL